MQCNYFEGKHGTRCLLTSDRAESSLSSSWLLGTEYVATIGPFGNWHCDTASCTHAEDVKDVSYRSSLKSLPLLCLQRMYVTAC